MSVKAANRYAKAFLATAIELNVVEKAKDDMLLISNTFSSSRELGLFLKSPIVKKEKKKAALEEIFNDKVQNVTQKLISVLSEKNRESLLEGITRQFLELYNRYHGIIEVNVVSAAKLAEKQKKELKQQLENSTGKNVLLHVKIDKELIGGLKVIIDDTVIDGTVKHKLSQLRERFTLAGIE